MRENVLSLEVVLPDGRAIRTARRARKSAAGYDLTRLFVGSEGTLGVITEVTVRLYGVPAAISSAVCSFPRLEAAVNVVIKTIQAGVPVARIELADPVQMDAINKYSKLDLPVAPTLWLEFHGTEHSVVEQAKIVQAIASEHGGADFSWTTRPEDRDKLWRARHDAVYAVKALREGGQLWTTVSACRFRDWPNASRKRRRTSPLPFYRHRSLAMLATVIFTLASCSIRMTRERWRRLNGSTNKWSIGRYRWTAPAPASTVSVAAR
jgi:FAD/FMN-containing dehydrogenase